MESSVSNKISEEKNGNKSPIYIVLDYVNCSLNHKIHLLLKMYIGKRGGKRAARCDRAEILKSYILGKESDLPR